ncbi:MAG TPA: FecR family protein [Polyangiales bacterium]|nr:FecR family protein [Polyangiales bacterium]
MDDLTQDLTTLRDKIVPAWGPARSDRAYLELARSRKRRYVRKVGVTASFGALVLVLGLAYGVPHLGLEPGYLLGGSHAAARRTDAESVQTEAAEVAVQPGEVLRAGRRVKLADGSTAELTNPNSQLTVDINQSDHVSLHLEAGTAHFEVVPNTLRRFSIFADTVEIVVIGTAFDVERDHGRVRVAVTHGKVRVRNANGTTFVRSGEARWFEQVAPRESTPEQPVATPTPSPSAPPALKPVPRKAGRRAQRAAAPQASTAESSRTEWRSLSQSGDPEGAYRLLEEGAPVPNDPEALMEAADAARLTNHSETAVLYLRKVLSAHRDSPATPLAAFTLGRVLLERLGRPAEAAEAFATARELAPRGSLAQDALAREVESWSKAGHAKEAYARSRLFTQLYPDSRRARGVQRYGGMLPP